MRLLSIAIDILRIETDTKFKTVGNGEIGGRDQREQLADSLTHTHPHLFLQNYFRIDEAKWNETQKTHTRKQQEIFL